MRHLRSLKSSLALVVASLLASLTAIAPVYAQAPKAPAAQESVLSPDVAAVFTRMGKTLQAKEFSFRSHTTRAYTGDNGELLHISHTTKVIVHRPDRLIAEVTGDDGATTLMYDGKNIVLYSPEQKKYVSIPTSGTIEKALDTTEQRVGADFPLADLLTEDPEKSVLNGVTAGGQVGTATIDGLRCNHFFFVQAPDLDMELWLEDNDRSLPRRVFITYRSMPGHPTFMADLSDWNFSVHPADADFTFHPPAGVEEAPLKPNAPAPGGTQK